MAVRLRLRRAGAKHQPRYRIVAADSRAPRDGRFLEVVGYYNPARQPMEFEINHELALKWLRRGAQPTETVNDLLVQSGVMAAFYQAQGKPVPPEATPKATEQAAEAPAAAAEEPQAAQPAVETAAPQAPPVAEAPASAPEVEEEPESAPEPQ